MSAGGGLEPPIRLPRPEELAERRLAIVRAADREIVIHLASILRVADALDTGHEGAVKIHRCEIEPRFRVR